MTQTQEIVQTTPVNHGQSLVVRGDEWQSMREQANMLVRSGFLPKAVDTPEKAIAIMMAGRELGIGPMRAIKSLFVVDGRVGMEAKLMHALVLQRLPGAKLKIVESTTETCTVRASRPGDEPQDFTWTIDDAKRADLLKKDTWTKYPRLMLRNRTISEACNAVFPDIIGGAGTPDELFDGDGGGVEIAPIDYEDPTPYLDAMNKAETRKVLNEVASKANVAIAAGQISSADRDAILNLYSKRKGEIKS